MAYNVAANMQFAKPVSAFIDARDNVTRNALAERQVANVEQNTAFNQQRLSATDQIEAQRRKAEEDKQDATYMHNALSYLTRASENPQVYQSVAQKLMNDPVFQKHGGLDEASLTPENIQAELASLATTAGIAPPEQYDLVKGERGAQIAVPRNGGLPKQIIGPDNTETPNYGNGQAQKPVLKDVQMPDGSTQTQWVYPGQSVGVPVGAPKPAQVTGADGQPVGKISDTQRLSAGYAARMAKAADRIDAANYRPTTKDLFLFNYLIGDPGIKQSQANKNISPEARQYFQALQDFSRAKLRKESGAVIGKDEIFGDLATFFPLPNDDDATILQKKEARNQALQGMIEAAGGAYKAPLTTSPPSAPPGAARVPDGVAIRNTSKSGRKIISRDGGTTWEYE